MSSFTAFAAVVWFTANVTVGPMNGTETTEVTARLQSADGIQVARVLVVKNDDCDTRSELVLPRVSAPRIELHLVPAPKPAPRDDAPSGFCGSLSGPLDGTAVCQFQLLA